MANGVRQDMSAHAVAPPAGRAALDETDLRILALYQEDASLSYKELARRLSMRTTTVFERVKRMKEAGVVTAIVPLVAHERLGVGVTAWVHVRLVPGADCCGLSRRVSQLPEVLEVHEVAGEWDILFKVKVRGNEELHDLTNRVAKLPGVSGYQSTLAVKTFREDPRLRRF